MILGLKKLETWKITPSQRLLTIKYGRVKLKSNVCHLRCCWKKIESPKICESVSDS